MVDEFYLPYAGPDVLELKEVVSFLVDVKEGGTKGLRRVKKGVDEVLVELSNAVPKVGNAAGVSLAIYAEIVESTSRLAKLYAVRSLLAKAMEVVEETVAVEQHKRESNIAIIANTVKSVARHKDENVVAAFQKTLRYHAQFAEKAWKTRRRNKKDAAEQAAQAEATEQPAQAAQTTEGAAHP